MTMDNDICDFCGAWVDPIGGDLAKATWYSFAGKLDRIPQDELWCGGCSKGEAAYEFYTEQFKEWVKEQKRLSVKTVEENGNEK